MFRLNFLLLSVAVVCALGVVTSQHRARKYFIALQSEKDRAQEMEVEWGQLRLELGSLALPVRVEKIASTQLRMRVPQGKQIQFVRIDSAKGVAP